MHKCARTSNQANACPGQLTLRLAVGQREGEWQQLGDRDRANLAPLPGEMDCNRAIGRQLPDALPATAARPLSRWSPRNYRADRPHSRHWCPSTRPRSPREPRRRSASRGCPSFLADLTATLHQIVRKASGQHGRHENHRVAQTTGEPDERGTGAETDESPANAEYRSAKQ